MALCRYTAAVLDDFALLERLIGFDTTSHRSNLPFADFVADYADATPDLAVERVASPDGEKANLILRFGPPADGDRTGLVLSGHMDVVPATEDEWRSDPFASVDDGERIYGRGSADMKGFLAVALNVAMSARQLKRPLVLVYTYDEEVGTIGARDLVERWPEVESLPTRTIIGEPTTMRVVRMHKGHLKAKITLFGLSAHSGYPHLGKNAIEAAARVLVSLRKLRHKLEMAGGPNAEHFPEVPFVPLNVGIIRGGSATNVVPDRCVIELGARALPGMIETGVYNLIEEAVANAAGPTRYEVELTGNSPPMHLAADSPVHCELCALVGQTGDASVSFATDAGWFQKAGMECVIFGPGSIEVAHKPNEFIPKADMAMARRRLEEVIDKWCR